MWNRRGKKAFLIFTEVNIYRGDERSVAAVQVLVPPQVARLSGYLER